ncbi:unnamed protein product [Ilex paraguariensis]|uniref:Uncharacterized protein n=1 Tax=Ilex paraguariensis TaxID=185542 RepID=A0ABC8RLK0_9AQUA
MAFPDPLGKGFLQRFLLNLCAHSCTRAILVRLLLDMIGPETEGPVGRLLTVNSQRLYGCQSNVVYGQSQLLDESSNQKYLETKKDKGKEKIVELGYSSDSLGGSRKGDVPVILFLKLLSQPLFLRSIAHLEQVMGLLQVVVYTAASKLDCQSNSEQAVVSSQNLSGNETVSDVPKDPPLSEMEAIQGDLGASGELHTSEGQRSTNMYDIFLQRPQSDLHNLCSLLGHEGLADKVYTLAGEPLGKGFLQRFLLNLCAHSCTRAILVRLLLDMIGPETEGPVGRLLTVNSQRLYGCQSNVVYGQSQLLDESSNQKYLETKKDKGKEKIVELGYSSDSLGGSRKGDVPVILFLKLLSQPLFLRSIAHLEQVMGLLQVVVYTAASKLDCQSNSEQAVVSSQNLSGNETVSDVPKDPPLSEMEAIQGDLGASGELHTSEGQRSTNMYDIFLQRPQSDLHNLCSLLGHEGLFINQARRQSLHACWGGAEKLALVAASHRKFFIMELSDLAHSLNNLAVSELITLRNTHMLGLSAGSMAVAAILCVLQTFSSLSSPSVDRNKVKKSGEELDEHATLWKLYVALEPLWQELSD